MKTLKFILLAASAILFASCAVNKNTSEPVTIPVSVGVNQNNFHFVKMVQAEESATYVFGIGGLSKKAMTQNAVAKMIEEANLSGSQTICNITARTSMKFIVAPIFTKVTVTAVGQVIEFDGPCVTVFKECK